MATGTFTIADAARADEIHDMRAKMFIAERRTDSDRAEFSAIADRAFGLVCAKTGAENYCTRGEIDELETIYFAADILNRAA